MKTRAIERNFRTGAKPIAPWRARPGAAPFLAAAFLLLTGPTAYASTGGSETALIRFPNDCGDRIVFSARGQVWSVAKVGGVAEALTSGPGVRLAPRCSPDGRWVAYTQMLGKARDVYVVPKAGGSSRRLTFRPDINNWVVAWTPDSRSVVVLSPREDWTDRRLKAYAVPVQGGLPVALPLDQSGDLSFAPDGHTLAYTRFFTDLAAWKRYQGGQAPKIFTYNLRTHKQQQITDWKGTDTAPMWADQTIYFLSDRDTHRRANIWAYDLRTHGTRQITHFEDYDVDSPSLGASTITFSQAGKLWALDLPSEQMHPVDVAVPDDGTRTQPHVAAVKAQLREWDTDYDVDYALSPDGSKALLAARGDLFIAPVAGGSAADVTNTSAAEEDHPVPSPDGRLLAYTTDSSGEEQLAVRPIAGGPEKLLTQFTTGFLYKPVWSPDGRFIAVHDSAHRLWVVSLDGSAPRLIAYNLDHYMHETDEHDAAFSPDSRWLAYSLSRSTRLRAMHLYDVHSGVDTTVSSPMESDYRPAFSADGRYLYFVSDRHESPVYADKETNSVTIKSSGVYVAALSPTDTPPFTPDNSHLAAAPSSSATHSPIEADLAGLAARAVPVPVEATKVTALEARGDRLFYLAEPPSLMTGDFPGEQSALHVYDVKSQHDAVIAQGLSSFTASGDGARVLFVKNGAWFSADADGAHEAKLDTDTLSARIDPREEWREMFFDSWRLERDLYIDADMHGIDWPGVRDHYAKLLPLVADRSDLTWLINQVIGELAGSHQRTGGGDDGGSGPPAKSVMLGVDYQLDTNSGRYRFQRVYPGDNTRADYRSPLTWPGVNIHEGDYLLAVNGQELHAPSSPDEALSMTTGAVMLTVASSPTGMRRVVRVLPINSEDGVRELAHFAEKRARVAELSGGRIAYIGITDMQGLGMQQFVRQFYPQLGAEALLIDDRGNPGGNIDEMILERLRRTISSLQTGRDRVPQTQPDQVLVGPKAMLIDGLSSSDGEVFPLHFRDYGLGELIGARTWGGVRGLRTNWTLLDGGTLTVSEISFYDRQGRWDVENHGLDPDVYVDMTPEDALAGRDPALDVGVKRLMTAIGPTRHTLTPPSAHQSDYPPEGYAPPTYLPPASSSPSPQATRGAQ